MNIVPEEIFNMEFKTETFSFLRYNPSDNQHREALSLFREDDYINDELGVESIINELLTFEEEFFGAYLVGNQNDKIIGWLQINQDYFKKYLELEWAVIQKYRGPFDGGPETTGSKIIRESSNYLLMNYKELSHIQAYIFKHNISSINAAFHAGFVKTNWYTFIKQKSTAYNPNPDGLIRR